MRSSCKVSSNFSKHVLNLLCEFSTRDVLLMSSPIPHVTGCMSAKRLMCVFVSRKGRKIGFALDVQMKKVNVGIVGHEESCCREKQWTEQFKKKNLYIFVSYTYGSTPSMRCSPSFSVALYFYPLATRDLLWGWQQRKEVLTESWVVPELKRRSTS